MSVKVQTRPATPGDYKQVLEMNKTVYEGFDYLPTYYNIYQQSPDCHPFVGEANGNVVGYFVLRITEAGQTALSAAGRVDPSLNGQGVFGQMLVSALGMLRQRVPTLKYLKHTGVGAKHFDLMEKAATTGDAPERIIMKWNFLVYSGIYNSSINNMVTDDAVELRADDAESVFSDVTNLVCLFPTGVITCYQNWLPLRVNYQTIMDVTRSHFTVCSFRESSQTKLRAVSFGFICQCPIGVRLDIYFYNVIHDVNILHQHVIKQIQHIMSLGPAGEKLNIMVHFPRDYAVQDMKDCLRTYLGENLVNNKTFKRQDAVALEGLLGPQRLQYGAKSKI